MDNAKGDANPGWVLMMTGPTHFQGASGIQFSLLPAQQLPLSADFLEVIFEARGDGSEWGIEGRSSPPQGHHITGILNFAIAAA